MSVALQATTLLRLAASKVERAQAVTRGFRVIRDSLGDRIARWAYADRGTELGHRGPSKSEAALQGWRPSVDDWCLVLSGVTGIGKTIAAARYVAERGGLLVNAVDADGWGFGGGEPLRAAQRAKWLLVDDVGDEKTAVGSANIASLITARAASGARLVCTTTLTPIQLRERGDHLASRLRPYFVQITDSQDRRTKTPPFLLGISRQFDLVAVVPRVRLIELGSIVGEEASDHLRRMAKLVGVDLSSADFHAAMDAEADRVREIEAMMSSWSEGSCGLAEEPTSPAFDMADLDWLDGDD